jgi:hypothetical protein
MLQKSERCAFCSTLKSFSEANACFSSRENAFFTGEIAIFTVASAMSESENRKATLKGS